MFTYPNSLKISVGKTEFDPKQGKPVTTFNIIEKRDPDGVWRQANVMSLGAGDVIRMWDAEKKKILMPNPVQVLSAVAQEETSEGVTHWVLYCKKVQE